MELCYYKRCVFIQQKDIIKESALLKAKIEATASLSTSILLKIDSNQFVKKEVRFKKELIRLKLLLKLTNQNYGGLIRKSKTL